MKILRGDSIQWAGPVVTVESRLTGTLEYNSDLWGEATSDGETEQGFWIDTRFPWENGAFWSRMGCPVWIPAGSSVYIRSTRFPQGPQPICKRCGSDDCIC